MIFKKPIDVAGCLRSLVRDARDRTARGEAISEADFQALHTYIGAQARGRQAFTQAFDAEGPAGPQTAGRQHDAYARTLAAEAAARSDSDLYDRCCAGLRTACGPCTRVHACACCATARAATRFPRRAQRCCAEPTYATYLCSYQSRIAPRRPPGLAAPRTRARHARHCDGSPHML